MSNELTVSAAGIFSSPESFEGYYARAAERLRARWENKVAFVTTSIEKLQGLLGIARAVDDDELAVDLQAKLAVARSVLEGLEAAPVPQPRA